MIRAVLSVCALVSALWAPWWATLLFIFLLSSLYSAWEVPVIGLIADLVWRPALGPLEPFPIMLLTSLILVWVCEPLRKRFFVR